ncbi:MAG: hypothetical protein ACM3N0_09840 [Chloroflexota bacterium]
MKRLKGPELKLSALKAPPVLSDLYWDLRDRRLLPLVALVVVAIAAVPFLLGGKSEPRVTPAGVAGGAPVAGGGGSGGARLVAVEAKPGLRNYKKRLAHRSPTDPFKPRYTGPQLAGTQLGGGETTTATTKTSSSTPAGHSETTTTTTTTESGGATPHGELHYFSIAADIKIVRSETKADGKVVHGKPIVQHRVIPPASVPNDKEAPVVYLGVAKNHKPLLLVSDAVKGIFGEGICLSGTTVCQLIEVETGMPETFVYGEAGKVRFKITVLKTKLIDTGKY